MKENNYFPTNLAAGLSFINPSDREGEQHLHPPKPIDIPLPLLSFSVPRPPTSLR